MEFNEFIINQNTSIEETLHAINNNGKGLIFVVDDDKKLVGVLTYGDIRRVFLNGISSCDKILKIVNKNCQTATNIVDAKKISTEFKIIPVIDSESRVKLIVGKDFIIPEKPLNCPVVIQAGGLGTRLYPYTKILPKPLIPIGDYPIIEIIMRRFEEFGCNEFYIIVNHKKEMIKSYFAESERKFKITFVDENMPLGTGGGLSLLKGKIDKPFFMANCDTFLDCNYSECFKNHINSNNEITMITADIDFTLPYGTIEKDENNKITALREKPTMKFLTNVGIYVVNPGVIDTISDNTKVHMTDICDNYIKQGKCGTFVIQENEWNDMGEIDKLNKMVDK